jgi:hypothetical protein
MITIRRIVFLLIASVGNVCLAQNIEIRGIAFTDNKLVIGYDLLDSLEGRFYSIRVYASTDGFLNPLTKIMGDEGLEVKPGRDKTISWAFKEELPPGFDGKVSVEVRGRIFVPFIGVPGISQYKVFKRKRKYNLTWTGGTAQNVLNFDLYNGEKKVHTFPNLANVGHYSFEFPPYIKPDKNYRFRISDTMNKEEVVYTDLFRIKRKVPLLFKVIPTLIAGYAAYFFLQGNDEAAPLDNGLGDPPPPGFPGS